MKYARRFTVRAPLARVAEFHKRPHALATLTPPLTVWLVGRPAELALGDEFSFRVGLGPLALLWRARISAMWAEGFVDEQVRGPFRSWRHQHTFIPRASGETEVVDLVEASMRLHPFWGPVGLAMWFGLPFLFAYRARKTRALLAREGRA